MVLHPVAWKIGTGVKRYVVGEAKVGRGRKGCSVPKQGRSRVYSLEALQHDSVGRMMMRGKARAI